VDNYLCKLMSAEGGCSKNFREEASIRGFLVREKRLAYCMAMFDLTISGRRNCFAPEDQRWRACGHSQNPRYTDDSEICQFKYSAEESKGLRTGQKGSLSRYRVCEIVLLMCYHICDREGIPRI
jgi:hypothetical protein